MGKKTEKVVWAQLKRAQSRVLNTKGTKMGFRFRQQAETFTQCVLGIP